MCSNLSLHCRSVQRPQDQQSHLRTKHGSDAKILTCKRIEWRNSLGHFTTKLKCVNFFSFFLVHWPYHGKNCLQCHPNWSGFVTLFRSYFASVYHKSNSINYQTKEHNATGTSWFLFCVVVFVVFGIHFSIHFNE